MTGGTRSDGGVRRETVSTRAVWQHVLGIAVVSALVAGVVLWQVSARATEQADERAEEVVRSTALALALPLGAADLTGEDRGWEPALVGTVTPLVEQGEVLTVHLWRSVDDDTGEIYWSSDAARMGDVVGLGDVATALATGAPVIDRLHDGTESQGPALPNLYEIYLPFEDRTGTSYVLEVYRAVREYDEIRSSLLRDWLPLALLGILAVGAITLPLSLRLARSVDRAERDRSDFADRAMRARAEEHRRIAEVLHEGTIQDLAAARLILESARDYPRSAEIANAMDRAADLLAGDIVELRALLTTGEATEWQADDLATALAGWVEHAQATAVTAGAPEATVSLRGVQTDLRLADPVVSLAFRVAKEAIRNALKHAGARRIEVSVGTAGAEIVVEVVDDGLGMAVGAATGVGLRIVRQSVVAARGGVSIEPVTGGGTRVSARLPVVGPLR